MDNLTDKQLIQEITRRVNCLSKPEKNILLMGPPGSGKGTQLQKIWKEYCWCKISTGDLLREAVAQKTPMGQQIAQIMQKGELVPDEVVIDLLKDKID